MSLLIENFQCSLLVYDCEITPSPPELRNEEVNNDSIWSNLLSNEEVSNSILSNLPSVEPVNVLRCEISVEDFHLVILL